VLGFDSGTRTFWEHGTIQFRSRWTRVQEAGAVDRLLSGFRLMMRAEFASPSTRALERKTL
jgi:hypothetical protein